MKPGATEERLHRYAELLSLRAVHVGIVAASDAGRIRERHIDDSLRALECLGAARTVADIGSGAGLPGIPIAIARPELEVFLIEQRGQRIAFLELCVEQLRLPNARVVRGPADRVGVRADACMARAVADGAGSFELASHVLEPGGWLVYFAGARWTEGDERKLATLGIDCARCAAASFPWQGPLVRMTRQEVRSSPIT